MQLWPAYETLSFLGGCILLEDCGLTAQAQLVCDWLKWDGRGNSEVGEEG